MPEVITNNLDLWTSVLLNKSTAGRGRNGRQVAYGIRKLRELILELAVRGKLVPQDPNDEPASVLLNKIAEAKKQSRADGGTKQQEASPAVSEDEIPHPLPRSWEWMRFIDVLDFQGGSQPPKSQFSEIRQDGYVQLIQIRDLGPSPQPVFVPIESVSKFCTEDDIMIGRYGASVGKVFWGKDGAYNVALIKLIDEYDVFKKRFLFNLMQSPLGQRYFLGISRSAQDGFSKNDIAQRLVPVPPLAEQHRIVAKVDELMALCDQLEQQQTHSLEAHQTLVEILLGALVRPESVESRPTAVRAEPVEAHPSTVRHVHGSGRTEIEEAWIRIANHFDTLFTTEHSIDQLKQTILQLAVMGKLVPQDPNDEPVSVFLEKVAQQKAKLIKAGKIRKQKELPKIKDDEIDFKLSAGWAVSRLGTFTNVGTGATPSRDKTAYWSPQEVSWVASGETNYDFIAETSERISSLALKETNVTVYPVGTLIVAMYGQGKTRGQVSELMIEAGTNQACAAVVLINEDEAHRKYLKLFFKKAYEEMRSHSAGGAQPNLNVGKISNTVVPIPPLPEQHRIVAKVDELMALCGALKARLADAQTTQLHLADAIVEQAIV